MKLIVPFLYEALIIKPRCSKPCVVAIRDEVEVVIREVSSEEMPVAFRVTDFDGSFQDYRWNNQRLWDFDYMRITRQEPTKVLASTVEYNTTTGGKDYEWSCQSAKAPFHGFWFGVKDNMASRHDAKQHAMRKFIDEGVPQKNVVNVRTWIDDNRQAVIDTAKSIADNLLICDGYMFAPVGEPRYVVMTFGLGNNRGGTALMWDARYNSNIAHTSYFAANQYDQALEAATRIATRRGDTKNLPIEPYARIEVLIPEAVRVNPQSQHGPGDALINK